MSNQPGLTCCITFDFDAMSSWIGSARSDNPSMISRGQFGAVAIPRILDLLEKYAVQASFAVPGHTAYAFPNIVKRIADAGHEIVHHGWVHESPGRLDEARERRVLERGIEALERVVGVKPIGWRCPSFELSKHSIALLVEYGFVYESSCMGHDNYPYYLRRGDEWPRDDAFIFGETVDLVEIPVTWALDDFTYAEYVPGFNEGLRPATQVEEVWRSDFDYALAHAPGGVYTLTMHPQTTGRGNRMLLLERLLEYFSSHAEVEFTSMAAYVDTWKRMHSLEDWKRENPDLTGENAIVP